MIEAPYLQRRILTIGIVLVPFLAVVDIVSIFAGMYAGNQAVGVMSIVKGLKDVLFVVLIVSGIVGFVRGRPIPRDYATIALVLLLLLAAAWSVVSNSVILAAAGVRAFLPIFAMVFLVYRPSAEVFERAAKLLLYVFFLHFIVQIAQMLFAPPIYGANMFGLAARNTGIFVVPATAGLFALLCFYMVFNFGEKSRSARIALCLLIPASIFMTGSASALALLFALVGYIVIYYWKYRWAVVPVVGLAFVGLVLFIDVLLGRTNILSVSATSRVDIFISVFDIDTILISPYFGAATNTAVLLSNLAAGLDQSFISDSLYASLIGNAGLLSMILFFYLVFRNWSLRPEIAMFAMLVIVGGVSTNLMEFYPFNLLFPFLLRYFDRTSMTMNRQAHGSPGSMVTSK